MACSCPQAHVAESHSACRPHPAHEGQSLVHVSLAPIYSLDAYTAEHWARCMLLPRTNTLCNLHACGGQEEGFESQLTVNSQEGYKGNRLAGGTREAILEKC